MSYQNRYEKLGKLTKVLFILCLVSMFIVYAQVVYYVLMILVSRELRAASEEDEIPEFKKASGLFIVTGILGLMSFVISMIMNTAVSGTFMPEYAELMSDPTPDPQEMMDMLVGMINLMVIYAIPVQIIAVVNAILLLSAWGQVDVFFTIRTAATTQMQGTKGTRKAMSGYKLAIVSNGAGVGLMLILRPLMGGLQSMLTSYVLPYYMPGFLFLALILVLLFAICGLISTIFQAIGISNASKGFTHHYEDTFGGAYGAGSTGGWGTEGIQDTGGREVRFDAPPRGSGRRCARCGFSFPQGADPVFCPNCGHKMGT
ncbi:MAG: hypothetical protein ACFFCS_07825 [Candidatus Hodarchaeota archaeon]